jgi:hypothetical protein
MKSPRYRLRKVWVNFIDLQRLDLSYCAIGIYVCLTASKLKEFSLDQLILASTANTISEIEYAIEELLKAGLVKGEGVTNAST